jgi:hypothetical protein
MTPTAPRTPSRDQSANSSAGAFFFVNTARTWVNMPPTAPAKAT